MLCAADALRNTALLSLIKMLKFVSHALSLNKNAWAVWKTVVLLDNKLLAGTPPGPTEQGWGGYDDTKGRMPAPQATKGGGND